MAGLSITGQMKVSTLQDGFLKEFGLTLRVYDGRAFADPTQTLAQVRKKKGSGKDLSVAKNMKVGNLEDKIEEEFGLKVQVAGSDDSYLCDNNLTLNAAQQEDEKKLARKERKAARQGEAGDDDDGDSTTIYPKEYGAWRYYAPAYLESDDSESEISLEIVRQILEISKFKSIDDFNNEMNKHNRGELPEELQDKLRCIFLGHDEIIEAISSDSFYVDGAGELPSPLMIIQNPEPCKIEIYAISIEKIDAELFRIPVRMGISSAKLFFPHPGYEKLCPLLIGGVDGIERDAESLNEDEKELLKKWASNGDEEVEDFDEFFEEAVIQLRYRMIEEALGVCTIDFENEEGDELSFYVTGDEEIGFS
jgi:hypothetical protein